MSLFRLLAVLVVGITFSISANASPITGSSLKGATGYLDVVLVSGNNYDITWSLDTAGFNDASAISSGHTWLTEVAFKISGMSNVTLLDSVGTLYFPSNVNNGGCNVSGSPAGFACVSLTPYIDATVDQLISVKFNADLSSPLGASDSISFRGKYGTSNGWVISESGTAGIGAPVAEPSILLLLGLGLAGLGFSQRSRVRRG